jgi:hypothetical protein
MIVIGVEANGCNWAESGLSASVCGQMDSCRSGWTKQLLLPLALQTCDHRNNDHNCSRSFNEFASDPTSEFTIAHFVGIA